MTFGPELIIAFLTLFVLELVLGVDNVVFISILTNRLPKHQQQRARIIGLSLAMVLRIVLLFFATWIVGLTATIIAIREPSRPDVVRRGRSAVAGVTRACTSARIGRRPSRTTLTQVPGTGSWCRASSSRATTPSAGSTPARWCSTWWCTRSGS